MVKRHLLSATATATVILLPATTQAFLAASNPNFQVTHPHLMMSSYDNNENYDYDQKQQWQQQQMQQQQMQMQWEQQQQYDQQQQWQQQQQQDQQQWQQQQDQQQWQQNGQYQNQQDQQGQQGQQNYQNYQNEQGQQGLFIPTSSSSMQQEFQKATATSPLGPSIDYLALARQRAAEKRPSVNSSSSDQDWLVLAEEKKRAAEATTATGDDEGWEASLEDEGNASDMVGLGVKGVEVAEVGDGVLMTESGLVVDGGGDGGYGGNGGYEGQQEGEEPRLMLF